MLTSSFVRKPGNAHFYGEDTGEEILYILRRSFITNAGWIIFACVLILAPTLIGLLFIQLNMETPGFITPGFAMSINAFWYLFTLGFVFERYLNWYFNIYIVTNKRVVDMDFYHLLARRISSASLRNIEDVTYHVEGVFPVLFNYGDVFVQTAGKKREFDFEKVHRPKRVQKIISDLVKEVKLHA